MMRKFFLLGALCFLGAGSLFAAGCAVRVVEVDAGYMAMWRGRPDFDIVYKNSPARDSAYKFEHLNNYYTPGARISLQISPGLKQTFEATFLGFMEWKGTDRVDFGAAKVQIYTDPPYSNNDWNGFYFMGLAYHSKLNSYEADYWYHWSPRYLNYFSFSLSGGVRYISYDDRLFLHIYKGMTTQDTMKVRYFNRMLGGQVGFDLECQPIRRCFWGVDARIASYANMLEQYRKVTDNNGTKILTNQTDRGLRPSFGVQMVPYMSGSLGYVDIRVAYEFLYFWNLGMAPKQVIRKGNFAHLHHWESLTVSGVSVTAGLHY